MANLKLNVVLGLVKGAKSRAHVELTNLHRESQKPQLYSGHSRAYRPLDDEGDSLPPENQHVQLNAEGVLGQLEGALTRLWDLALLRDEGNRLAVADVVVVGGRTVAAGVPATYLLFLEKQLEDVHTFVAKLPTTDPGERWEFNADEGHWATAPVESNRTTKQMQNHVLAAATDRHPAQVQVYTTDVVVGKWTTTKFSGALAPVRKGELLRRVNELRDAVKVARERANLTEVAERRVAADVFAFLLGDD